jgi:hypothetical protein
MKVEKIVCPFCKKQVRVIRPRILPGDPERLPFLSPHNQERGRECVGTCLPLGADRFASTSHIPS